MSFSPASFVFPLSQAVKLHAPVIGQSALLGRPEFVIKAVAARLRIGVRALEAFLRRLLILMALEMEHDLVFVARPENLARAKPPKLRAKMPLLAIYPMPDRPYYFDFEHQLNTSRALKAMSNARTHAAAVPPVLVPTHRWLAQLDYLETIAKDPIAKAQRLAFSLARRRHGLLMAPPAHPRVMQGKVQNAPPFMIQWRLKSWKRADRDLPRCRRHGAAQSPRSHFYSYALFRL